MKTSMYIWFNLFLKEITGVGCKHEYCKDCWRQYLSTKISGDGHAGSICCPAEQCSIIVDDATIMELVSDKTVREKYQLLITNSFVEVNEFFFYW